MNLQLWNGFGRGAVRGLAGGGVNVRRRTLTRERSASFKSYDSYFLFEFPRRDPGPRPRKQGTKKRTQIAKTIPEKKRRKSRAENISQKGVAPHRMPIGLLLDFPSVAAKFGHAVREKGLRAHVSGPPKKIKSCEKDKTILFHFSSLARRYEKVENQ